MIFHIKSISIEPINARGFISIDTVSRHWIRNYDSTQLISPSDLWSQEIVPALLTDGCMTPYISFDDTYWGVKIDAVIAWIHLERSSDNGLRIKEFAVNTTKNNPIKGGQIK